ncbi:MAG: peroxiredoxin-like family protein [Phycisphaerales bacterium]
MFTLAPSALLAVSALSLAASQQPAPKADAPAAAPVAPTASAPAAAEPAMADGAAWVPGVPVGFKLPDISTIQIRGAESKLSINYKNRPAVVVFYRGGWCPYCVQNLKLWSVNLDAVRQAGANLVAISPEKIVNLLEVQKKHNLAMPLVTDYEGQAAKAFNVNFTLDAETQANYTKAGLNLADRSSRGTWDLPVPATFVVDTDGTVLWAHADKDYTKRASPKEVIEFLTARKARIAADAAAAKKDAPAPQPAPDAKK